MGIVHRGTTKSTVAHLEIYHHHEDENSCHQVEQVWQVLSVERLAQPADLVVSSGEQVEQGDDSAFKFSAPASIDGGRAERLPHNSLADVGGNEEGDSGAQAVAFLQQLVQ